ncbi:response regulator [Paenibacillus sp. LjRoot56]|uniref:response regulator n=1 Tax=Paenibacillus sp. LjRoot56 TaxID=3342333 RepID=UPI003ECC324C
MKIMIVDDEEKIRLGLSKLIVKASPQYEIIGVYASGAECLEGLKKHKPDVVITDIKMSGMTGLELAKTIKQLYIDTKCVILSGYGEFEYARSAISSGVSGYLLKPVDKQEFYQLLSQLAMELPNKASQEGPADHAELPIHDILLGKMDKLTKGFNLSQYNPSYAEISAYLLVLIRTDISIPLTTLLKKLHVTPNPAAIQVGAVEMDERTYVILLGYSAYEEAHVHTLRKQLEVFDQDRSFRISIGISKLSSNLDAWEEGYREALYALEFNFYSQERAPRTVAGQVRFGTLHRVEPFRKRVLEDIEILDMPAMETHVKEMLQEIGSVKIRMHHLFELVETLSYALKKEAGKRQEQADLAPLSVDWTVELKACFTYGEASALIGRKLLEGLSYLMTEKSSQGHVLIYQIKKIIELEYAESLDLNSLSKRVFLTPSYLSKLFKLETGTTVIEYIISVRMNKAKELLKEQTQLKTYQVGEMVGYKDPAYFNKQFKKVVGLTPKEYKDVVS